MKKIIALCCSACVLSIVNSNAQGVGISPASITPDPSSILELRTTAQGFLAPRMTAAQRLAIGTPATGLLVYDTDSSLMMFYNGTQWRAMMVTPASTVTGGNGGPAFKAVAGNVTNGLPAYNTFHKLPFMNINTSGYNVGGTLSNNGAAIFTTPAGGGVFHFKVRLHFSADAPCTTNYAIRFLRNNSVATDAQKNGILVFGTGFDIQEAWCSKDFLLNAGDTIEVEYSIATPSAPVFSFWMIGSVGNLTSSFSGNRLVSF